MFIKNKYLYVSLKELNSLGINGMSLLESSNQDQIAQTLINIFNKHTNNNYKHLKLHCLEKGYLLIEVELDE